MKYSEFQRKHNLTESDMKDMFNEMKAELQKLNDKSINKPFIKDKKFHWNTKITLKTVVSTKFLSFLDGERYFETIIFGGFYDQTEAGRATTKTQAAWNHISAIFSVWVGTLLILFNRLDKPKNKGE